MDPRIETIIARRRRALAARGGVPWSAVFAAATAVLIAVVGFDRFETTFRPAIQLAGSQRPVPNDVDALEPETVAALAEIAEVIAPAEADSFGIEHLGDRDLAALDTWLGTDFD